jgi:hypothetical protein
MLAERRRRRAVARRRLKLQQAPALARARMYKREQARWQRRRDQRGQAQGIMININAHIRGQSGKGSLMIILIILFVCLIALFLISLPLMMMLGVMNLFASKLFDLPGVQTLTNALTAVACNEATGWLRDALGDITAFASGALSGAVSLVQGGIGDVPVVGSITTAAAKGLEAPFALASQGMDAANDFLDMMCSLYGTATNPDGGTEDGLLQSFKNQGLEEPFRAALSCANWPDYLGSLKSEAISSDPGDVGPNSKDGKHQFCLDPKKDKETQSLVPKWLIPIYQAAASQFNVPWEVLAAINWNDTSYGAKPLNSKQKKARLKIDAKYSEDMLVLKSLIPASKRKEACGLQATATHDISPLCDMAGDHPYMTDSQLKNSAVVKRLFTDRKPDKVREQAQAALEASAKVASEWQQVNSLRRNRAGWIPLSAGEWNAAGADWGGVPLDWNSGPYPNTVPGAPQGCPVPVDVDGNIVSGAPSGLSDGKTPRVVPMSVIGPWPGDNKGKPAVAQWMADAARKVGLPGEMPVMAALVESGLVNTPGGDRDSVGYFQMRTGYHNKGRYRGYPQDPRKQLLWFLQNAADLKNRRGKLPPPGDDIALGLFIADVERPAAQYRDRYGKQGDAARKLIKGGTQVTNSNAAVDVSFVPDGQSDTCDPVDSIFALADWLSRRGASGYNWDAALQGTVDPQIKPEDKPGTPGSSAGNGPVYFEGDSLTDGARSQIKQVFKDRVSTIDAEVGRQVTTGIENLKAVRGKLPNTIVFALGANGIDSAGVASLPGQIKQVMRIAGKDRCVVWPTVYANGPKHVKALTKATNKYPNLIVPRWDKKAARYILPGDPERIHVNSAGSKQYAKLMLEGAKGCGGAAPMPKNLKIKGGPGQVYVDRSGGLTMYSGATQYAAAYHNKKGEIPRKGGIVQPDPNDNNLSACEGGAGNIDKQSNRKYATNRYPGVAIKVESLADSSATVCGYWEITDPKGKSMIVMQSDVGPGAPAAHLDVNATLAQEFGYKTGNSSFPSFTGVWRSRYLGKKRPANVNQLGAGGSGGTPSQKGKQAAERDTKPPKSFRPKSVPPLKSLAKPNSKLPSASWVHAPVAPLKSSFPSFNSGLGAISSSGRACDASYMTGRQAGVIYSAASAFSVPWQLLAAYAGVYSNFGCEAGDFSAYKSGYETDALGDGEFSASDPVDAVFSNARSLYALGGADNPAKAARALTTDRGMLSKVASMARGMGYDTTGMTKLMDDNTSVAIQSRNHLIDKNVCKEQSVYVECIAYLYRKIKGADEPPGAGKYLTGGCKANSLPDLSLKPLTDKDYVKNKTVNKVYNTATPSWGRKDAITATRAVLQQFQSCYPKYKSKWKELMQVNDWGAALKKPEWAVGGHASHQNGGDNDTTVVGVTSFPGGNTPAGTDYNRTQAIQLAKFFLRAGAPTAYFDDVKVQKAIIADRKAIRKSNASDVRKLKSFWNDAPVGWAYGGTAGDPGGLGANQNHHNHFHVRWYPEAGNAMPPSIKVWLSESATADEPSGSTRPANGCPSSGPYGKFTGTKKNGSCGAKSSRPGSKK